MRLLPERADEGPVFAGEPADLAVAVARVRARLDGLEAGAGDHAGPEGEGPFPEGKGVSPASFLGVERGPVDRLVETHLARLHDAPARGARRCGFRLGRGPGSGCEGGSNACA